MSVRISRPIPVFDENQSMTILGARIITWVGRILGRLLFAHAVGIVSLFVSSFLFWVLYKQLIDVWASVLLGIVLPEAFISSGFFSGWLVLLFAVGSVIFEQILREESPRGHTRNTFFLLFVVFEIFVVCEAAFYAERGPYVVNSFVTLALTIFSLYAYSVYKQSGGNALPDPLV